MSPTLGDLESRVRHMPLIKAPMTHKQGSLSGDSWCSAVRRQAAG